MPPAQQRFQAGWRASGRIHLRLKHQKKFAGRDAAADVSFKLRSLRLLAAGATGEMLDSIAASLLGRIHRGVGIFQKIARVGTVLRIQRDAN